MSIEKKAPQAGEQDYGVCLKCGVENQRHCRMCDGPWCPVCEDW
ncbi:hypothetical protein [Streptomyces sp. NPDC127084]